MAFASCKLVIRRYTSKFTGASIGEEVPVSFGVRDSCRCVLTEIQR